MVIIIDFNTNYYENSHKDLFIYVIQAAEKAVINLKLKPLQLGEQIYRRVEGVIAIKPEGLPKVKYFLNLSL